VPMVQLGCFMKFYHFHKDFDYKREKIRQHIEMSLVSLIPIIGVIFAIIMLVWLIIEVCSSINKNINKWVKNDPADPANQTPETVKKPIKSKPTKKKKVDSPIDNRHEILDI